MSRRELYQGYFLLLFLFSCIFFPPLIEAFPYQAGWPKTISADVHQSVVVADLDNDGFNEIIFTAWQPFSVYVYKYTGQIYNRFWPKIFSRNSGSAPTVADLDGDSDLEIIVGSDYIYAWHHDGKTVFGFPTPATSSTGYAAPPAVGDLTGDGIPEITAGNADCEFYVWDNHGNVLNGFPKTYSYPAKGSCSVIFTPAIGDIDLDGINEVIVPVDNYHVYAYNADGSIVSGNWDFLPDYGNISSDITLGDVDNDGILEVLFIARPLQGGYYPEILNHDTSSVAGWPPLNIINKSPGGLVMGDLDNDGKLEVVTGNQFTNDPAAVYVWEGESGQIKNGWPVVLSLNDNFMRNMILGDVNGDGNVDIIGASSYGWNDGRIYAWDVSGNLLSGFPIVITGIGPWSSTCFITDIDNDGDVEIGVGVTNTYTTSKILIWDLPYPYKGRRMPWPQDRHDPMHTNNYHWYDPLPQVPELGLSGLLCLIVLLSLGIAKGRRQETGDRRQEAGDRR